MPDQDVADVVVVQRVVEGKRDAAGVAEDAIDAFPEQGIPAASCAPLIKFDMSSPTSLTISASIAGLW